MAIKAYETEAKYQGRGESITVLNDTEAAIAAGSIVAVGYFHGVAGTDAEPGEMLSVHTIGIYVVPKKDSEAIEIGDLVCLGEDGKAQKHADGDTPFGVCVSPAKAEDGTVTVQLTN